MKKQEGITLIALVVTIVVLLILAGVTITMVLGEGGILNTAKGAADKTNNIIEDEQENIKNLVGELSNILSEESSEEPIPSISPEPETPIEDLPIVKDAIAGGVDFAKDGNKEITDDERKQRMWVPQGFIVTEGDKIKDGVVVQDPQKNEFVWVPVGTIGDMVYCYEHTEGVIEYDETRSKLVCKNCENEEKQTTNFAGKLYANSTGTGNNFDEGTTQTGYKTGVSYTGIREPDVLSSSSYDGSTSNLAIVSEGVAMTQLDQFKEQLQTEFNEMATSVGKYKGFYIGRYETSNLRNSGATYSAVNQGQVVKNAGSINNANWYRQYVSNKKIGSNYTEVATTSMIWGCQWDACMKWFLSCGGATANFVKNSEGKGNYEGAQNGESRVIPTGSNDEYAVNKIYDMAGNVWDWTIEANLDKYRVSRGGCCDSSVYDGVCSSPACYHLDTIPIPTLNGDRFGSRSTLYVK